MDSNQTTKPTTTTGAIPPEQNKNLEAMMATMNISVNFDSLSKEEQHRILTTPQFCICGCGTQFDNPVSSKNTVKKFIPNHQLEYIKLLRKPVMPNDRPRIKKRHRHHKQNTRHENMEMKQMREEVNALKIHIKNLVDGSILKKPSTPHIDDYVKSSSSSKSPPRSCMKCKSEKTYYNKHTKQDKWYIRGDGVICNACYNREWVARKIALKESEAATITRTITIPTTTAATIQGIPAKTTMPQFTGNEYQTTKNQTTKNQIKYMSDENKRLQSELNKAASEIDRLMAQQFTRDLEIKNLKKDVEVLENEITEQLNKTKSMMQNKDGVIKSQSDAYIELEEAHKALRITHETKYKECEQLQNRVNELEALKQELQSKINRKDEDAKLATDTVVSQYRKVIDLEEKNRVLQREKEAWVKSCAEKEKAEKDAKNKPNIPLTFKPVS